MAIVACAVLLPLRRGRAEAPPSVVASGAAVSGALASAGPDDEAGALAARELTAWLDRLVSSDALTRQTAVSSVDRATPAMLPAIATRLFELGKSADRTAMATLLAEIVKPRSVDRDEIAGRLPDGGFRAADDWWGIVMASPSPERDAWRDLASILGLSRLLSKIGTTPAVRELAALFGTYGELLRSDVERQLVLLGDRALPALIELRRSEPKEQRLFALKLLDALGKAIPGEAVQTGDDRLLAQVLLAYGRAKEVEAARVILSFANSERRPIREAARQAVMLLAEAGALPLRESYENMTNQRPPEAWNWEIIARELFADFDRARLVDAYALMDEGLAAFRRQDVDGAASAFDRALARDPAFEKRAEMAPGYLAFARKLKEKDRPRASANFRKAMRVDPSGPVAHEAEAELLVLEAKDRADHGVVDEDSLRRAMRLDPGNAEARAELQRIEAESRARSGRFAWYIGGALTALFVLWGIALRAYGRRSAG